jgi:hypothetical protein
VSQSSATASPQRFVLVTPASRPDAPLTTQDQSAVLDAIGALELADGPVPATLPALAEPALRAIVAARLAGCGRVLMQRPDGFVSGYDDTIANELLARGIGCLHRTDRAVLALVLLRTVAIPRARGKLTGDEWVQAQTVATTVEELAQNRHLTKTAITTSVRRLRGLGLIRVGHRSDIVPGPQFQRLTPGRSSALWEDLLLLTAPSSSYARVIRARRAAHTVPTIARTDSPTGPGATTAAASQENV